MQFIEVGGRRPVVHPGAWVAPTATLIGSVTVEEGASIWYGCVLRADHDQITIGPGSQLQDGCLLHTDPGLHLRLGADASVGHGAVLHGCTIGEGVLVGMRATVLNRAWVGAGSIVAAAALVAEDAQIPERSLVMGVPGRVVRTLSDEQAAHGRRTAAHYRELAELHRTTGQHIGAGDVLLHPRPEA